MGIIAWVYSTTGITQYNKIIIDKNNVACDLNYVNIIIADSQRWQHQGFETNAKKVYNLNEQIIVTFLISDSVISRLVTWQVNSGWWHVNEAGWSLYLSDRKLCQRYIPPGPSGFPYSSKFFLASSFVNLQLNSAKNFPKYSQHLWTSWMVNKI